MAYVTDSSGSNYPWNHGQYTSITIIGYGTCGTVYKVRATCDEKEYALKRTHVPPNNKDFERCKREIKAIASLAHPCIVRYFTSFNDEDGKVNIQMELCEKDLQTCLDDREVTVREIRPKAVKIMDQLLQGIDYVHSQKLIHRDLKPSNIFVIIDGDGLRVKIGDFGLVSFEDDEMTSRTGAPLYRAPEQEFGEYNSKVDIYTLGIVLFEIVKKKFDVLPDKWIKCIKNLRRKTTITLREFEPYEPAEWEDVFISLLKQDADERPTAKQCLEALIPLLQGKADVVIPTQQPKAIASAQTDDESEKIIVSSWSEPKNGRKGTKAILEVEQYRMKAIPRGICLIISNTCFVAARKADIDLGDRDGGSIDVEKLKDLFEWLKFKVETFNDLTRDDMDRTLMSFANMDHKEFDCFVCCILTHGSKEGLFGTDGEILDFKFIKDLYNGANCPSLGQKPKLFFLQCCRGELMDKGFCTDGFEGRSLGGQIRATDPIESDFFIGYPTPLGS